MNLIPSIFRSEPMMVNGDRKEILAEATTFKAMPMVKQRASRGYISRPGLSPEVRKALSTVGKVLRMYDAALTTNLNSDMPISLTSSNAEILTSIIAVRSRARTLERNNPYGAAMVWDWMRNVGGADPFRLEMKVGSTDSNGKFTAETDTNQEIMGAWKEAGRPENCTVMKNLSRRQVFWQSIAAMSRDGGTILRFRGAMNSIDQGDKVFKGNKFGFAVQPIEIDRLDQNWQRPKTAKGDANEIQFGVEMDSFGAPLFYHILTRHPGDIFAFSNSPKYRVPVPAKDIIYLKEIQTRPEQIPGMSRMAPVITMLHRLEQFDLAHITAALTACCKSIWIEKLWPNTPEFIPDYIQQQGQNFNDGAEGNIGDSGWGGGEGQRRMNVAPGELNEMEYGQSVKQLDAKFPAEAAPSFRKDFLRAAASATSVWYNTLAQDMESVNFASGRLGENATRDVSMMTQEHVIDMMVRPWFEQWLKYYLLSGLSKLSYSRYWEFCQAAVLHGRRWQYTNPMQDVQADILSVEAGLDSRSHIIGESPRGGDAEEVNREQQADRESDKLHGLDFSAADVTKPTIGKGLPGEDKPNPFDAATQKAPGTQDDSTPAGAAGKQSKGVDLDRLERALHIIAKSDDEFVLGGDYENSMAFIVNMRKIQAQKKRQLQLTNAE